MNKILLALFVTLGLQVSAAQADDSYEFYLSAGAGEPVCERVLEIAQAAGSEVIEQCDLVPLYAPNAPPEKYIDWLKLRTILGPEFWLPDWEPADLETREDLEMALFVNAIWGGRILDEDYPLGNRPWTEVYSDHEVIDLVRRFLRDGPLPREILVHASVFEMDRSLQYFKAALDPAGPMDELHVRDFSSRGGSSECILGAPRPLRFITFIRRDGEYWHRLVGPIPQDDIFYFEDVIYGVEHGRPANPGDIFWIDISSYRNPDFSVNYTRRLCRLYAKPTGEPKWTIVD